MEKQLSAVTETLLDGKERISREVGGMVNEAAGLLKSFSAQSLQGARGTLSHAHNAVTEGAKHYTELTDEYVRANPWKTLGVAAAAGLLIGLVLARR